MESTSGEWITTIPELEECLGKTPGPMHQKVIDHLDDGAQRWIAASPLMFAGFGSDGRIAITLAGGAPGFLEVVDPTRLRIASGLLDAPELARTGHAVGALILVPGLGETLRINGRVAAADTAAVVIDVEECYVHCAKALIRSNFWAASPQSRAPSAVTEFLSTARFLALATIDRNGRADVSPKGDPAGAMIRLSQDAAWFADRPGNRRADSFRNILTQPRVAIAALVPGMTEIVLLDGAARLSKDEGVRFAFAVRGRRPLLATCIDRPGIQTGHSAALARARLWPAPQDSEIDAAAVIAQHVKLNGRRGVQATLVRALVSVPGMMQKGLDRDYKDNLY